MTVDSVGCKGIPAKASSLLWQFIRTVRQTAQRAVNIRVISSIRLIIRCKGTNNNQKILLHSKKTTVFFSFHVLYSSEHKVGLATLDEPLAVLLHVGVMIADTTLIPLPIANERHETV